MKMGYGRSVKGQEKDPEEEDRQRKLNIHCIDSLKKFLKGNKITFKMIIQLSFHN